MTNIVTITQVQQKIGQISASITEKTYIVTKNGNGKIVMLPYFDGCDDKIIEYMEDYEMYKNSEKLKKELKASEKSGKSSFVI